MRPLALAPRRLGPFTLARGDGYAVVGYFPRATRFDPRRGHLLLGRFPLDARTRVSDTDESIARSARQARPREVWSGGSDCAQPPAQARDGRSGVAGVL